VALDKHGSGSKSEQPKHQPVADKKRLPRFLYG
jgi:hypothetical protein